MVASGTTKNPVRLIMTYSIREMKESYATEASGLVLKTFWALNAVEYEDPRRFTDHALPEDMRGIAKNGLAVVAEQAGKLIGVAAIIDGNHLELMFVDPDHHRQGVGKAMWDVLLKLVRSRKRQATEITVNASHHGTAFYKEMGFHAVKGVKSRTTGQEINRMVWSPSDDM